MFGRAVFGRSLFHVKRGAVSRETALFVKQPPWGRRRIELISG
ncbi:hypothetical protein P376_2036 [Streptomyces sp. HCCB10043]|nr:hypothetical protein P376_2036 [Streptomyces sp. HCCB10043]